MTKGIAISVLILSAVCLNAQECTLTPKRSLGISGSPGKSSNLQSKFSVGVGTVEDFSFDGKTHLLLSADFTLFLWTYFYAEFNYDFVKDSYDFVSLSPGARVFFPNRNSSLNFGFGLGFYRVYPLGLVPSFKYEYNISNMISLGLELKYPLISSHYSKLFSNINFIIYLK